MQSTPRYCLVLFTLVNRYRIVFGGRISWSLRDTVRDQSIGWLDRSFRLFEVGILSQEIYLVVGTRRRRAPREEETAVISRLPRRQTKYATSTAWDLDHFARSDSKLLYIYIFFVMLNRWKSGQLLFLVLFTRVVVASRLLYYARPGGGFLSKTKCKCYVCLFFFLYSFFLSFLGTSWDLHNSPR